MIDTLDRLVDGFRLMHGEMVLRMRINVGDGGDLLSALDPQLSYDPPRLATYPQGLRRSCSKGEGIRKLRPQHFPGHLG